MQKKRMVLLIVLIGGGNFFGLCASYQWPYAVILAGGDGTRLWPLSRQEKPKQFLSVVGDKTLLEQTLERSLLFTQPRNVIVSTTRKHVYNITRHVGHKVGDIIVEPGMRNTGPAILLCCMELYKKDPDATIVFLPADPFIPEEDYTLFHTYVKKAIRYARWKEHIVLLGVKPTRPATGYGYIQYDAAGSNADAYAVQAFKEKPDHETAVQYLNDGNKLWNIGMFCGKCRIFIEEYMKHAPKMFAGMKAYLEGQGMFEDIVADSIDYAIMEKSDRVSVLPVDFSWCDVGNLEVFASLVQAHGKNKIKVLANNKAQHLIHTGHKCVACVGVGDLVVVEKDGVLLIAKRDEADRVKEIVNQLKEDDPTLL